MIQKEISLLLQNLSEQLSHGVKVVYLATIYNVQYVDVKSAEVKLDGIPYTVGIGHVKPYLRPMSSMTEEERLELSRLTDDKFKFYLYTTKPEIVCYEKYNYLEGLKVLDWLNEHHFDYRGLIEKGLALEAPDGIYTDQVLWIWFAK